LTPAAGLGDIVIGSRVVGKAGSFPADPHLLETASHAFKALGCAFHVGPILTVDEVITSADRMQRRAGPEILAVDMESAHLAGAAERQGCPFLAIRVVSDTPSAPWATEERHLLKPDGRLNTAALVISLLRHPSRIPRLLRLASALRPATRRLAQGIAAFLKDLGVTEGPA
jgi:nucleoside phosphorylase